jgi:hypothetical protein
MRPVTLWYLPLVCHASSLQLPDPIDSPQQALAASLITFPSVPPRLVPGSQLMFSWALLDDSLAELEKSHGTGLNTERCQPVTAI